jgi:uncharacterized protein
LLAALLVTGPGPGVAFDRGTLTLETASGSHRFEIEVATTDQERALGLMYRRHLPADAGMLFLYDTPQAAAMWMKNTPLPLDIVFIDAAGRVHRIERGTEPFSTAPISSEGDIIGVLELNAGRADAIGLKPGDRVRYPGLPPHTP